MMKKMDYILNNVLFGLKDQNIKFNDLRRLLKKNGLGILRGEASLFG